MILPYVTIANMFLFYVLIFIRFILITAKLKSLTTPPFFIAMPIFPKCPHGGANMSVYRRTLRRTFLLPKIIKGELLLAHERSDDKGTSYRPRRIFIVKKSKMYPWNHFVLHWYNHRKCCCWSKNNLQQISLQQQISKKIHSNISKMS